MKVRWGKGFCLSGRNFEKIVFLIKFKKGRSWKNIDPEDMSPVFRRIWDDPENTILLIL